MVLLHLAVPGGPFPHVVLDGLLGLLSRLRRRRGSECRGDVSAFAAQSPAHAVMTAAVLTRDLLYQQAGYSPTRLWRPGSSLVQASRKEHAKPRWTFCSDPTFLTQSRHIPRPGSSLIPIATLIGIFKSTTRAVLSLPLVPRIPPARS